MVIDCVYDEVKPFKDGMAKVKKNKKEAIIDNSNRIIVPFLYDNIDFPFIEGTYSCVYRNDYPCLGVIDKKANEIISPYKYDYILVSLNDDIVQPGEGFDTHPHRDMEILSYVVEGRLTHKDSMGNESSLTRGQVQYMSAGTGVLHSEHNHGDKELRFLQIWISPDAQHYPPNYGDAHLILSDRIDHWLPIATSFDNKESSEDGRDR